MYWVNDDNVASLTDLYELSMLQAYWREGMEEEAVFSLFARKLPRQRNYLVACGLDDALGFLEGFHFSEASLAYLARQPAFSDDFLEWLRELRFTGRVYAVREGTPVFANEPLVEVIAPLPEGQIAESLLMNQVHFQTVMASGASRVVTAAQGRKVVDFGMRRMHGADAALKGARAFYVAGVHATSNVLAGQVYGVPVAGTMAHSYIQAHDDELEAFRQFQTLYPETILLVDTYDTLVGVRNVVRLSRELGDAFRVKGVRLDSGELADLANQAREILDAASLERVTIFASGGLDEYEIARLVKEAPAINGFGVGTRMGVSQGAPALDMAYKITAYAGRGRLKLSSGKTILPGRKQVFRLVEDGTAMRDVLARDEESHPGRPLLHCVMSEGKRLETHVTDLREIRAHARQTLSELPARLRSLEPSEEPYPVEVSASLARYQKEVTEQVAKDARAPSP